MNPNTHPAIKEFHGYGKTVFSVFDAIHAADILSGQTKILIKPNLINASPHPVTTPAACCAAVIEYIRSVSQAAIVIGEGCGDESMETHEVFSRTGYDRLSEKYNIPLVDLNTAPLTRVSNSECSVFPEMHLPTIALTHFIISVPVLKAHSLATITGSMKNMMGIAPPTYYSGGFGGWKKAVFHKRIHQAILDLNRYCTPGLTLLDATIGLADYHLGGRRCDPPVNQLIAGFDPAAVDRKAAECLGLDWRRIPHLLSPNRH
jgi:uncharacterized protein (DUF362 family)